MSEVSLYPGGNPGANLKSIPHRYYLREVAFEWELNKETIYLPLGCLKGGYLEFRDAEVAQQHLVHHPARWCIR